MRLDTLSPIAPDSAAYTRAYLVQAYAHDIAGEVLRLGALTGGLLPTRAGDLATLDHGTIGDAFEETFLQFHYEHWSLASGNPEARALRAEALETAAELLTDFWLDLPWACACGEWAGKVRDAADAQGIDDLREGTCSLKMCPKCSRPVG